MDLALSGSGSRDLHHFQRARKTYNLHEGLMLCRLTALGQLPRTQASGASEAGLNGCSAASGIWVSGFRVQGCRVCLRCKGFWVFT